jgi:hypothetical protein
MAKLPSSTLVDIQINLLGAAASVDGFGVPMIIDTQNIKSAAAGVPVITTCYNMQDLANAGYATYTKAYKLALALSSQSQRVAKFKVASVSTLSSAELSAVEAADGIWYALLLTSRSASDISTVATWCEGVATRRHLFFAESQDVAAFTGAPSTITTLETANAIRTTCFARKANAQVQTLTISAAFVALNSVTINVNGAAVGPVVFAADSDTTLANLASAIAGAGAGAICTAAVVPVGGGTANDRVITITALDPLVDVVLSGYACTLGASQNTASIATTNVGAKPCDAALAGKLIPQGLGQATAHGKTLAGPATDDLSSSEYANVTTHGGNVYVTIGNIDQVQKGQTSGFVAAGQHAFVDTVAMRDRLESDVQAAVMAVLTPQVGKLPFNNTGIAAVAQAAINVCQRYVALQMLEPFKVATAWHIPDISEVSGADKTARHLGNITANLVGTGAIQSVSLTLNISV